MSGAVGLVLSIRCISPTAFIRLAFNGNQLGLHNSKVYWRQGRWDIWHWSALIKLDVLEWGIKSKQLEMIPPTDFVMETQELLCMPVGVGVCLYSVMCSTDLHRLTSSDPHSSRSEIHLIILHEDVFVFNPLRLSVIILHLYFKQKMHKC